MQRVALRSAVLALMLTAGACGGSSSVESSTPLEPATAPTTTAPQENEADAEAPTTTVPAVTPSSTTPSSTTAPSPGGEGTSDLVALVGGGQIDLNSIEGQDTVLWFWAPW